MFESLACHSPLVARFFWVSQTLCLLAQERPRHIQANPIFKDPTLSEERHEGLKVITATGMVAPYVVVQVLCKFVAYGGEGGLQFWAVVLVDLTRQEVRKEAQYERIYFPFSWNHVSGRNTKTTRCSPRHGLTELNLQGWPRSLRFIVVGPEGGSYASELRLSCLSHIERFLHVWMNTMSLCLSSWRKLCWLHKHAQLTMPLLWWHPSMGKNSGDQAPLKLQG